MNRSRTGFVILLFGVTGTLVWLSSVWAQANRTPTVAPAEATAAVFLGLGDDAGPPQYVGSTKCKKCHLTEHKSWEKTKKAHALESLAPGNAKDAKERAKLDPAKDYTKDAACVKCHTTGFGEPGGYAIPEAGNEEAAKAAKKLEGVGCESCHGPGSKYLPIFEEITKSKRKYKVEELYAAGLTKIDAATCTACHNDKSPTFDAAKGFDFAKSSEQRDQIHEKVEMKQRE